MYCLKTRNFNHFTGLLLLLVVQFYGTKSSTATDCSQTWSKDNTVVLSPTNSTQQFGLEPLNVHFNTYQQSNSPGALSQLIPISDIAYIALPNNATCGIHYNGHQSTLGVIALLFPFHGFT